MARSRRARRLQERLGAEVRALRERAGVTQERLAERVGYGARHVQKIEAGEVNLTLDALEKLGSVLKFSVDVRLIARDE